jgi:hypothetical protein
LNSNDQKNRKKVVINKPIITIVTVNFNTADFIELMLLAFSKITQYPYKVVICDNGSKKKDILKLVEIVKLYNNILLLFRNQTSSGSIGHGEALDFAMQHVDTQYFVVMDSDATFLHKKWDEILISRINESVKAIGTSILPGNHNKATDFPLAYGVLFETQTFFELKVHFTPTHEDLALGRDTGWTIRQAYHKNGLAGDVFEIKSTRDYKKGPFRSLIASEYYLRGYQNIFACHFGRGSTVGLAKYKNRIGITYLSNIPFINHFIAQIKGYFEKKKWIKICKDVIAREAEI